MTPHLVAGLAALAALALLSGVCAARSMLGQARASGLPAGAVLVGAAGAGLLAFGARLCLARGRVSWAPYLDQWDAEILGLLLPLSHGTLGIRDMVAANNEHRVALSRALSLLAVELNGEWDNRVEVLLTFALQALTVAWVSAFAWCVLGLLRGTVLCLAMLVPMVLVCDWENLVLGFQAVFCLLILGSVVAFSMLSDPGARPLSALGAGAVALLVLGTMASGLLTALSLAAAALAAGTRLRPPWRRLPAFCAAMAAIAAAGWLTRAPYVPGDALRARGAGEFLSAMLAYGAWPFPPTLAGFALLWSPWAAFVVRTLRRGRPAPCAPFVIALGLWVLLQAAALSWSRAGLSDLVRPRYTEVLSLGLAVNSLAFVALLPAGAQIGKAGRFLPLALAAWFCCGAASEAWRSHAVYRPYLAGFREQTLVYESRLVSFMRTGNGAYLTDGSYRHIPYAAPSVFASAQDPGVRRLLPAPMRPVAPGAAPAEGGPLTVLAERALRSGAWFLLGGSAALLLFLGAVARAGARGAP